MTRPAAAFFHIVGLGISGLGLKKIAVGFPFYIIVISCAVQLLGLIVYSNPNAPIKLRQYADGSLSYFLKVYLTLAVAELIRINQLGETFLLAYLLVSIILISITTNVYKDVIIILQCSVALYICFILHKQYSNWQTHLVILFLLNSLIFPRLSARFAIPDVELSSVSLIFLNIFLINSFS